MWHTWENRLLVAGAEERTTLGERAGESVCTCFIFLDLHWQQFRVQKLEDLLGVICLGLCPPLVLDLLAWNVLHCSWL